MVKPNRRQNSARQDWVPAEDFPGQGMMGIKDNFKLLSLYFYLCLGICLGLILYM